MRLFVVSIGAALLLPAQPLTLEQAVECAARNYGAVKVSTEQSSAAAAAIGFARTAYLPKVDGLAQVNRATRNNVFGILMPNSVIMPISGPPNPENSATNVWGSAVGVLVSWEPFDFGLRQAQVDVAQAGRRRADAAVERTRFDVSVAAADAFLTILAAEQTVEAAKAGVERARTLSGLVAALVKADLRPGADASRAHAELAIAKTHQIQAEQAVEMAKAALRQYGVNAVTVDAGKLLEPPPGDAISSMGSQENHPAMREQQAALQESAARMKVLDRSYFPKFNLQSGLYARGTGANPDFSTSGGLVGLGPNIHNWGAGFSATLPLLDFKILREKRAIESAQAWAETARATQIGQDLDARQARAQAMLNGSLRVLANLPVQIESARTAETQATARYRAGLGTLAEVADAQRLVTQSEIDLRLGRLAVWRAHLARSAAHGDLGRFLAMVKP